jgi:hypothetical protein
MAELLTFPPPPGGRRPRRPTGLPDFDGIHGPPLHYVARLDPSSNHRVAWLYGRVIDGVPERRPLCQVRRGRELCDVSEALWLKGANPRSEILLWWGDVASAPERVQTTTLSACVPAAFEQLAPTQSEAN